MDRRYDAVVVVVAAAVVVDVLVVGHDRFLKMFTRLSSRPIYWQLTVNSGQCNSNDKHSAIPSRWSHQSPQNVVWQSTCRNFSLFIIGYAVNLLAQHHAVIVH